ncbi:MAG: NAD(P)H-dependent oxidoreductase [Ruminococcus sp.]|nr:NAD(P)H-dependent oxidoreductase [Ruminococcus sp.]
MKIAVINGQNHKGSTYHLGHSIAEKIQGDKEITEFFLPRDLEHFCTGCYKCIEEVSDCPFYAEKKVILDAVEAADILIFTTPTYAMHMSAPLKTFFDLTFDLWMVHRPMDSMFSKKAVIVSTSAGASPKSAMKDVEDALFWMGVPKIYKLGMAVHAMNWQGVSEKAKAKIDKKTSAVARKLSSGKKPSVGIKTRFMFRIMGMLQKKGWNSSPVETQYWKDKGWLDGRRPWKN